MSPDAFPFPWSDCADAVPLPAAPPALPAVDGQPWEGHSWHVWDSPVTVAAAAPATPPADGQPGGLGAWPLNLPDEATLPPDMPDAYGHPGQGNGWSLLSSAAAAASPAPPATDGQLREVRAGPSDGGRGDAAASVARAVSLAECVAAPPSVDPLFADTMPLSSTCESLSDEVVRLLGRAGTPDGDQSHLVDLLDFHAMDYRGDKPDISFPANDGELAFGQGYTPLIAPVSPLRTEQHGPAVASPPPAAAASPREVVVMEDQPVGGARPRGASCKRSRARWMAEEVASAAAARVDGTVVSVVVPPAVPGGGDPTVAPTDRKSVV